MFSCFSVFSVFFIISFFVEIHVYDGNMILVTTGDVLSFAFVYPDSLQLSPHV